MARRSLCFLRLAAISLALAGCPPDIHAAQSSSMPPELKPHEYYTPSRPTCTAKCICFRLSSDAPAVVKMLCALEEPRMGEFAKGRAFVAAAEEKCRGLEGMELLKKVNGIWNALPWKTDIKTWGVSDMWAKPAAFAERGGDCEDFAIAKYKTLLALGWPKNKLWLTGFISGDGRKKKSDRSHLVLEAEWNGRLYVLDSAVPQIYGAEQALRRYGGVWFIGAGEHAWVPIYKKDKGRAHPAAGADRPSSGRGSRAAGRAEKLVEDCMFKSMPLSR